MNLIARTYNFDTLYGAYLLFTLGASYYVIYKWKTESLSKEQNRSKWKESWPKIFSLIIVVGLYLFQNEYRTHYSLQASAEKTLNNMFSAWEMNEKNKVIDAFENLSGAEKPWNPNPYSEEEY